MPPYRLGPTFDTLRNRGVPIMAFIYIGFVKRNDDALKMGRLSIWVPEISGAPDDEGGWIIANYASPFAGATDIDKIAGYNNNPQVAQQSYGLWMVPPDLNNEVAIFFANGDISRAYWFACTYQTNMNHMVPGVAVNVTTEPSPPIHVSPVIEYNKADKTNNTEKPRRPPFRPLTDGLNTEGLMKDLERGQASTSARREAPSKVFGLLTPRANTVHIDDQSENEFIRIRTRSGTQVMVNETTGFVYINSKLGNAWLEVSDAGVDVYSKNSVSIRAEQDLNVRADRNIMLDAGASISMRAKNITIDAGKDINVTTGGNLALSVAADGSLHAKNDFKMKADNDLKFESGTDTSLKAGGVQLRDGSTIQDNAHLSPSAGVTDATVPKGTDTLDTKQARGTWTYGAGKVNTIAGRMPTHEPWGGHPNSKVPPPPLEDAVPSSGPQGSPNPSAVATDGCSFGAAGTKPISDTNFNAITAAADKVGVPQSTMLAFSDIESGHNAAIGNIGNTSTAKGLYQFTDGTWKEMVQQYGNQYNVSTDPSAVYDPNSNALMGAQFLKNNSNTLQKNGIEATPGNLYLTHLMGASGGVSLIKAAQNDPSADASLMFPKQAAANQNLFKGKTVGQVYEAETNLANSKAVAYANQQGQPAPCQRPGATNTNPGNVNASPTATGAVAAAESNLGKNGAQVNDFLHSNGQSLDATQNNWCAAYTNASLNAAGLPTLQGTNSNIATNFLKYGNAVDGGPQQGDVMVQARGLPAGSVGGHVGLATGETQTVNGVLQYQMISGNATGTGKVSTTWEPASGITLRRA